MSYKGKSIAPANGSAIVTGSLFGKPTDISSMVEGNPVNQ